MSTASPQKQASGERPRIRLIRSRWQNLIGSLALVLAIIGGTLIASAPAASAYGPRPPTCTITVSISVTRAGITVRVSGHCGFIRDVLVITIHSTPQQLATTTAGPGGAFSLPVTIPPNIEPGQHVFTVTDESRPGLASSTGVTVVTPATAASGAAGPSSGSGTSGSSGPLAFTGLDPAVLLAIAAAALGLGGMLVLATRRRRQHHLVR